MAVVAGIDEAGLGPILGPLVVSGVAFRVPDGRQDQCLWRALTQSCTRRVSRSGRRLAIADSKRLFRPPATVVLLERAALVMLAQAGHRPGTFRRLLDHVAPQAGPVLDRYPWYGGGDLALPSCRDVGDIATKANAVRRDCAAHGIKLLGVTSEPLDEGRFNGMVGQTRNKASVLLGLALCVADRLRRLAAPGEPVRLYIDRVGGRVRYREVLATALPEFELQILEESAARSAYRLTDGPGVCQVEFLTEGEQRHFPVALASIYSKYLRELYMALFNRFWCAQYPALAPTAGYYQDAQRWLRAARPHIRRLRIDTSRLVRQR